MHTVKIPLTIDDSILTGVVADVPSGKKKTFEISVLDSTGTLVYYGKDSSTINPGSDNPIHIKVYRVTGKATVNGIVSDAPISFSGLVSYFTFNETAKDSIGDNHGQLRGSPTPISDRNDKANSAYYFGKNNYITLPNLGLTGDVSVFGWVKIDSTSTHPIVALLSQGESGGMRWHLETQPNYLVYYDRRGEDNAPYLIQTPIGYHKWFFFGAVSSPDFPSPGKVRLFLNGKYMGAVSTRPISEFPGQPLNIGRYYNSDWAYCDGAIDDIRIYKRALSDSEVLQLYEATQ